MSSSVIHSYITGYFCIKLDQIFFVCILIPDKFRLNIKVWTYFLFHSQSYLNISSPPKTISFFLGPRKNAWLVYGDKAFARVFHPVFSEESSSLSSSFLSPVPSCSPLPSKRNVFSLTWYCCFHLHYVTYICLSSIPHILPPSLQSSVYRKLVCNFPITGSQDPSVILSPFWSL